MSSIRHRGKNPKDELLFANDQRATLFQAANDVSWLLERDYPPEASLKLVGDRFKLRDRQRLAVGRAAASTSTIAKRKTRCVHSHQCVGRRVAMDALNTILTVESLLSHSIVLRCQDGTFRDMASVHGTYRTVDETDLAIRIITEWLSDMQVARVRWLIDQPVSNSGRLKQRIESISSDFPLDIESELVRDPDYPLKHTDDIVITTDSVILDACQGWTNLVSDMWFGRLANTIKYQPYDWLIDFQSSVP
jgi:hypothetical protein